MRDARPGAKKKRAWRFGLLAEEICVWHLRLRGYRILARGFRTPRGEIDIIARRGRTVAIIEVKARQDYGSAAHALGRRQRGRIARATAQFLAAHPGLADKDLRFDVMLVGPWGAPSHLTDAWRDGD